MLNTNTTDSLRRVFYDGFIAGDIAEPLASFDVTASLEDVGEFMLDRPLTVVGIREQGILAGFIQQHELDDRPLMEQVRSLSEAVVASSTMPLHEVVACLDKSPFLLVATLGQPVGVVVRADIEKPPMRMWLFGMVTLFEISLTRIVAQHYANESWTDLISASRLEKAKVLQDERARRGQQIRLIDCLQLGDKGQLLARSDELRTRHWNRSRHQIEKSMKQLESLRNHLAHSQPLVEQNWGVIVRVSATLDQLLAVSPDLVSPSSLERYS